MTKQVESTESTAANGAITITPDQLQTLISTSVESALRGARENAKLDAEDAAKRAALEPARRRQAEVQAAQAARGTPTSYRQRVRVVREAEVDGAPVDIGSTATLVITPRLDGVPRVDRLENYEPSAAAIRGCFAAVDASAASWSDATTKKIFSAIVEQNAEAIDALLGLGISRKIVEKKTDVKRMVYLQITKVDFENLVGKTEATAKRLCEYLGEPEPMP